MNIEEIKDILELIAELDVIGEVKIVSGDINIQVKKVGTTTAPLFTKATNYTSTEENNEPPKTKEASGNVATPGQLKYARDLIEKVFDGESRNAMDYLAHTLELPLADIPEPERWETTLTKDMVGPIIDALDRLYRQQKKGGYK